MMQGHIVQIGPNEFSLDSPDAIEQIYRGSGAGYRKVTTVMVCECVLMIAGQLVRPEHTATG